MASASARLKSLNARVPRAASAGVSVLDSRACMEARKSPWRPTR